MIVDKSASAYNKWNTSPLFGVRPDTLALLQVDIPPASKELWALTISKIIEKLKKNDDIRWQFGVGSTFFGKFPELKCPKLLRPLRLNGDSEFGIAVGADESDFLIIIGGEWDITLKIVRRIIAVCSDSRLKIRSTHIGYESSTQRDHSGFLDGTSNLQELSQEQFKKCIEVQASEDPDFSGSSYFVFRKYREDLEMWNDLPENVQEQMIGRKKQSGYFLTECPDWTEETWRQTHLQAHIRCANPRELSTANPDFWKERIFRRGIKYTETDSTGNIQYGLLFIAIVRDPVTQFERIHNERLLPEVGSKDIFIAAGYVKPLLSAVYILPKNLETISLI